MSPQSVAQIYRMTAKPKSINRYLCLWLLLCIHLASPIQAQQNANEQLSQPALAPYTRAPEALPLSTKEQRRFDKGKAIYKEIPVDNGKRLVAIFKVNASPQKIWSTIHNFQSYPKWIKGIRATHIYRSEGENIFVHFKAHHWLLGKTQWYVHHRFPPIEDIGDSSWGHWTLDYQKPSDFKDSVGFWQVVKLDEQASKVIYSADLLFKHKKPAFIRRAALKSSLKDATQWLKVNAEQVSPTY